MSKTDISREAVEKLVWRHMSIHRETAAVLLALRDALDNAERERDAMRSHQADYLAENDALRFALNTVNAYRSRHTSITDTWLNANAALEEALADRNECVNALGRVTEELDLPEGSTAARIIAAIRNRAASAQQREHP
jgi:hypothetical protein